MMIGYYDNKDATNEIIKLHHDGLYWIHTGDLGRVDKDGLVYIEGRLKRMIVRYDGFKVFPPFIEKIVLTNSAIEACCAVGLPDKANGQGSLPIVFCVKKPGSTKTEEQIVSELKTECLNSLPEYSQPIGFRFISILPVTAIGKVDYRALEEMAKEDTGHD